MSIASELKKAAERAAWTDPALSAEIGQIAARAEAAEADARRWRKLREMIQKGPFVIAMCREFQGLVSWSGDTPDAAIDAELAKEAK